jgi:hypothetical protein
MILNIDALCVATYMWNDFSFFCFELIGDEVISTILPLITEDDDAKIQDTNEIRIGPITRTRAKLLNQ